MNRLSDLFYSFNLCIMYNTIAQSGFMLRYLSGIKFESKFVLSKLEIPLVQASKSIVEIIDVDHYLYISLVGGCAGISHSL